MQRHLTRSTRFLLIASAWYALGGDVARGQMLNQPLTSSDLTQPAASVPSPTYFSRTPPLSSVVPNPAALHDLPSMPVATDLPAPPPGPNIEQRPLPDLWSELYHHGGSQMYQPEGDKLNWSETAGATAPFQVLRLPETYEQPQPLTLGTPFLGSDMLNPPNHEWPGPIGYAWDPRFVAYGGYSIFGFTLDANRHQQQSVIGHQLTVELDLRLTGTERFHAQFLPLGQKGTGGSYYQFSQPDGYVNNAGATPDRFWFEGELQGMTGGRLDQYFTDINLVAGKMPFALHNNLLMNDDILGVAVSKDNIVLGGLSNLNLIGFYAWDDVGTLATSDSSTAGFHSFAEYKLTQFETTLAAVNNEFDSNRDQYHAALSVTKFFGPTTLTGRAMLKWGDTGGLGSGELYVLEANHTREFISDPFGIEYAVFFCNAFHVTPGWNGIAKSSFNRLRLAFETNPLIRIAARGAGLENTGVTIGAQLSRRHEDESLIPEIAFESPGGAAVLGLGLRYQRKTGPRSYFDALGVLNYSNDPTFDRRGIFLSQNFVF
jgi:hypothetical protein